MLALLLALSQDTTPPPPVVPETPPPALDDGAITTEDPPPLKLAPKPSPLRRTKPSGPTTAKYFENGDIKCTATLAVDNEGKTTSVTMVSALDQCAEPFQHACMRSMKYWKFLPAQQDGRAIASSYDASVIFHKDGSVEGADPK